MSQEIRKALISGYGDESNVSVISAHIDEPAKGEVQVRVLYSGFNGADVNMRLGRYPQQQAAPLTPGYCFVGIVEKNGSGCKRFSPGTLVCSLTVYGSEAELTNVAEQYLISVPHNLDIQKACALILDWTTAYGLVNRAAKVKAGWKVFVHGLSGAVGLATGILSQSNGAKVYGTASQRHHETLKALGFEPFVYNNKDWMTAMTKVGGADAAFDPLGYESWDETYSILSHGSAENGSILVGFGHNLATMNGEGERGGKFASTMKLLGRNAMAPFQRKRTRFFYITKDDKTFEPGLQTLFNLLASGQIDVKIKGIFDLEDVREAHYSWTKGGAGIGSMLIRVGDKRQ